MEVVGERPPPLPPKCRINLMSGNFQSDSPLKQSIAVRDDDARETEDGFRRQPKNFVLLPRIGSGDGQWNEDETRGVKSSNGRSAPRIITWAQKSVRSEDDNEYPPLSINTYYKSAESDGDDFLYQNVNNAGTNYIEYKLNGIIKSNTDENDGAKNWRNPVGNRQIEVHQVQNKTVVKISIKDDFVGDQVNGADKESSGPVKVNGTDPEIGYSCLKAVEGSRKACGSCDACGDAEYENVSVEGKASDSGDKSDERDANVYTNWNANRAERDCTYENEDFDSSKKFRVGQGFKERRPGDADENGERSPIEHAYENQTFGSEDNAYENVNVDITHGIAGEPMPNDVSEKSSAVIELTNPKTCVRVNVARTEGDAQKEGPHHCQGLSASDPLRSLDQDSLLQKLKTRKVMVTISSLQSDKADPDDARKDDPESDPQTGHKRAESLTSSGVGVDSEESDDEDSNISCDSLNSNELNALSTSEDHGYHTPNSENKTGSPVDMADYQNIGGEESFGLLRNGYPGEDHESVARDGEIYENCIVFEGKQQGSKKIPPPPPPKPKNREPEEGKPASKGLLPDIQNVKLSASYPRGEKGPETGPEWKKVTTFGRLFAEDGRRTEPDEKRLTVNERTYDERKASGDTVTRICDMQVDTDKFYKFHLFENKHDGSGEKNGNEDETFAGVKDYLNREKQAAIKSAKGTIRGVKNRVKAGIATFLQMHENKTYKDKDAGKIVVYSTTMGIVRDTYHNCLKVKQILRTLMVKFEERDVFMSKQAQDEIKERMKCHVILVPQVFVEGQHIGDAETIERLNESGELRNILKPYKSADACSTCQVCGGYRLLPCQTCKGSKKSIHRNHFTAEFVALKCMNCDQVGLTKCYAC